MDITEENVLKRNTNKKESSDKGPFDELNKMIPSVSVQAKNKVFRKGNFVVIGTCSTGPDIDNDEIYLLCGVKYFRAQPSKQFFSWVKPQKALAEDLKNYIDADEEWMAKTPSIDVALKKFDKFLDAHLLVCFDEDEDLVFLKEAYRKHLNKEFNYKVDPIIKIAKSLDNIRKADLIVHYDYSWIMTMYCQYPDYPKEFKKDPATLYCFLLGDTYKSILNDYIEYTGSKSFEDLSNIDFPF